MALFASSSPGIKVKLLPRWPASVTGVAPITTTAANGNLQVGYDASSVADGAPVDRLTARVLYREGQVYKESTVNDLIGVGGMAIATFDDAVTGEDNTKAMTPLRSLQQLANGAVFSQQDADVRKISVISKLRALEVTPAEYGAIGDGVTDDTTALRDALAYLKAAGGGILRLSKRHRVTGKLEYGSGVIVEGDYVVGSGIYGFGIASGPVLSAEGAESYLNCRVTAAVVLPASGSATVTLRDIGSLTVGDTIVIWKTNFSYALASVTALNAGAKTATVTVLSTSTGGTLSLVIGDMCWNLSRPGPEFCGVRNLYVEGCRDNANGLQNVCLPQTRTGAGALALNGAFVWGDGSARSAFCHNTRLVIHSNSDNSGINITVTGFTTNKAGAEVAASATVPGPGGPGKPAIPPPLFSRVTGVSTSGTVTGFIWCGLSSLGDGAGVLHYGFGPVLENLLTQRARGWGVEQYAAFSPAGWTSAYATQVGVVRNVQTFLNDGGGINVDSYVDGQIVNPIVNQVENQGLRIGRFAPNLKVMAGHVSAAYESSLRFQRQYETVYVEGDTAHIMGMSCEGGSDGNIVILGNNVFVDSDTHWFDPNNGPLPGGAAWLANRRTTSPNTPRGLVLGDSALGWAATNVKVTRARSNNNSGGHVWVDSDGGYNLVEVEAWDVASGLTSGALAAATTLNVATAGLNLVNGQPVYVQLDSGAYDTRTVQSFTSNTITLTSGIAGAAAAGNLVARGLTIGGVINTSLAPQFRSRFKINGLGINNPEYRYNWHEQSPSFGGTVTVRTGSNAFNQLVAGAAGSSGFLASFNAAGTRVGYAGFWDGANYVVAAEGSAALLLSVNAVTRGTFYTTGIVALNGGLATSNEVSTSAATYTVTDTDNVVIFGAACTVTLPTGAQHTGRELVFVTTGANAIISALSNVIPITGGAAGTAIVAAAAGTSRRIKFNGTNWRIIA